MDKVNVLIVSRVGLHPGYLEDIAAVDKRISVKDGLKQFVDDLQKRSTTGPLVERLKKEAGLGRGQQVHEPKEDFDTLLAQAEVIFGSLLFPEDLLRERRSSNGFIWETQD